MPQVVGLHVRANRVKSARLCGKGTLIGISAGSDKAIVIPMTCKSWECPTCQPVKTKRWIEIAQEGKPERFITLTCDSGRFGSAIEAAEFMNKKFTKLVERIRKKYKKFEYIKVWELHKSGYPHLHLITRGTYIDQKWLSAEWDALGVGKIVDIRKIHNPKVTARYVMKYMGKGIGKLASMWEGIRIITKSQNWLYKGYVRETPPGVVDYTWHAVKDPFWMVLSNLASCNVKEISFERWSLRSELDITDFDSSTPYSSKGACGHILNARALYEPPDKLDFDPANEIPA